MRVPRKIPIIRRQRLRRRRQLVTPASRVHDLVTDQDAAARAHGVAQAAEDFHAVVVGPVVDDVPEPVDVGVADGVGPVGEEVVLYELDAVLR